MSREKGSSMFPVSKQVIVSMRAERTSVLDKGGLASMRAERA